VVGFAKVSPAIATAVNDAKLSLVTTQHNFRFSSI
jgi:hypothetical protein